MFLIGKAIDFVQETVQEYVKLTIENVDMYGVEGKRRTL